MCLIEVTIGEIESSADVSGACRQLSITLAVLERVIGVLAAPRAASRGHAKSSGKLRQASSAPAPGAVVMPPSDASEEDTLPLAPCDSGLEQEQQRGVLPPSASNDSDPENSAAPRGHG